MLTVREKEIADCLALGPPNKQIAEELGISNQTLRNHLVVIFIKLNVKTRTQAAIKMKDTMPVIDIQLAEAEHKAWNSLSRYNFVMFAYWADVWVHLNKLSATPRDNPFHNLVKLARESCRQKDET